MGMDHPEGKAEAMMRATPITTDKHETATTAPPEPGAPADPDFDDPTAPDPEPDVPGGDPTEPDPTDIYV